MPRVVILGTGTGVGKTFVTLALAEALAKSGRSVLATKPVETGLPESNSRMLFFSDARRLELASTIPAPRPHPLYAFREAVSPHLAARREKRSISLPRIKSWVERHDMSLHDHTLWMLVETAGGAFSPLSRRASNLDLALSLDPSLWILVAPDSLGVLHDVTVTLAALKSLGRMPDSIVLSQARVPDPSTGSNATELARLGIARPIATFARTARNERATAALLRELSAARITRR